MPTYVYHCEECDNQFEVFQKFSDPPRTHCLEGHERIRKVFVPAGIIFKGSGWYSKDSKPNSSSQSGSSSASSGSSDSSNSSSSSSDETAKGESASSDSTESTKSETKASTTTKSDE